MVTLQHKVSLGEQVASLELDPKASEQASLPKRKCLSAKLSGGVHVAASFPASAPAPKAARGRSEETKTSTSFRSILARERSRSDCI